MPRTAKIAALVEGTITKWIQKSPDYSQCRCWSRKIIHDSPADNHLQKRFACDDVVLTAAYTGAAAFNIGGKTFHSSFGINSLFSDKEMTMALKTKLLKDLRYIIAIFIDERSMLPAEILGAAERNVSTTCHGAGKQNLDWGGVPIVILYEINGHHTY